MGPHRPLPIIGAALMLAFAPAAAADEPAAVGSFPTVPPNRPYTRLLLANAMRYADPAHKLTDPISGYPFEGWNHDVGKGVYLRAFTQLTAIGLWMEMLAAVAVGDVDVPYLTRDAALADLTKIVKTLRQDQRDPAIAAKGLLSNFLDLTGGKRTGPLASEVEKQQFEAAFGKEKGDAVWRALVLKGWLAPWNNRLEAGVRRGPGYGFNHFDGPLAPFKDDATRKAIMGILDRRVVSVVFGDNANLSSSAARTIGALLKPDIKDRPEAAAIRKELEAFLDEQRPGYAHLYDPDIGLFYFGWDATRDKMTGWEDLSGKWTYGHQDYLINEFRGPAAFVVLRFGLPADAFGNLGFKVKPYIAADGKTLFSLAPWEGSAFQALGLTVWAGELASPSWRALLETAVDIEIDYSTRNRLPGFLSESYTDNGNQYTGAVGIPAITVNPQPRITDAPSLYTLGPASTVSPEKVERFLAAQWPGIRDLLTDHGPWEGYNVSKKEVIRFQTTGHTLSLALGLLGTDPGNMTRYLEHRDLTGPLAALLKPGEPADLLTEKMQVFAWGQKGSDLSSTRDAGGFRTKGELVGPLGLAVVHPDDTGTNLSGGTLALRYRFAGPAAPVRIELKPAGRPPAEAGRIPNELFANLTDTGGREEELRIPLPATPGLARVKQVVLNYDPGKGTGIDLTVTGLRFEPMK